MNVAALVLLEKSGRGDESRRLRQFPYGLLSGRSFLPVRGIVFPGAGTSNCPLYLRPSLSLSAGLMPLLLSQSRGRQRGQISLLRTPYCWTNKRPRTTPINEVQRQLRANISKPPTIERATRHITVKVIALQAVYESHL